MFHACKLYIFLVAETEIPYLVLVHQACPVGVLAVLLGTGDVYSASAQKSTVCHLGPSANSGHYIAVVRHGDQTNKCYVYDDAMSHPATTLQISIECFDYKLLGALQSYILIYEECAQ